MPDESCRQCGGELESCLKCFHCTETIQFTCKKCENPTDVQFHSMCMYREGVLCQTAVALA
jgi:hypothetical protein